MYKEYRLLLSISVLKRASSNIKQIVMVYWLAKHHPRGYYPEYFEQKDSDGLLIGKTSSSETTIPSILNKKMLNFRLLRKELVRLETKKKNEESKNWRDSCQGKEAKLNKEINNSK